MKLICNVCGSDNVCMSIQTAWDWDRNAWINEQEDNEWITFELKENILVEIDRQGFYDLTQKDVIEKIKSDINVYDIGFGCSFCEEETFPTCDDMTTPIDIFNKLT